MGTTCGLYGVDNAATAWRMTGLCPACGALDLDVDFNRPYFLAWLRKKRHVAGKGNRGNDMPPAPERRTTIP